MLFKYVKFIYFIFNIQRVEAVLELRDTFGMQRDKTC